MVNSRWRVAVAIDLQWLYKRHTLIFAGTQSYADKRGWTTTVDEFPAEALAACEPNAIPYDGIVARASDTLVQQAERLGVPVVNVWLSSPVCDRVPGVFPDFETAGQLRAEHLLSRGLRQFAAVAPQLDRAGVIEAAAFRKQVEMEGFSCEELRLAVASEDSYASQVETEFQLEEWMNRWTPPIGVFVYGDVLGRIVAQLCRRRDWRVPQDVALVAGDNEETICERPSPALTSIERNYQQVGYRAAELLDDLMRAKAKDTRRDPQLPVRHIRVPPGGMVIRESTDFFAVTDETVAAALIFISEHSHLPIGQDDVAQAVAVGTRTLQRRFRATLDCSIAAMVRHVRFERAKRELAHSERSLKEIAVDVGYGDPMRMYDAFRRELGISPTEYRRRHQPKQFGD